jgi:hypothetical protein
MGKNKTKTLFIEITDGLVNYGMTTMMVVFTRHETTIVIIIRNLF